MKLLCLYLLTMLLSFSALSISAQSPVNASFYQDVNWSPDGESLSFTKIEMTTVGKTRTMKSDVFTVKADGKDLKKITSDDKNEHYSTWSKDGKKIAFSITVQNSETSDIFVVSKDGKDLEQLTKDAGRNSAPAFSPDGKKLAFMSTRDGGLYQIYVMDVNGGNPKRLTNNSKIAYFNPQWSPDSKKIVYYSEIKDNKDQIWTVDADGKNPTLITNNIGHNFYPSFSPDGKIIFISSRDGEKRLVCTINPDGSNLKIIKGLKASFVRFSPDGKKLAYIFGNFPTSDIYIAKTDGSGAVKLLK